MSPAKRRLFFSVLEKNNPSPTTELNYENNYQLLVAVVLSAQATDKSVNAATSLLFESIKKPEDILALGESGLIKYIRGIGLYRSKARYIISLSEMLLKKHDSCVPQVLEELEELPGVGRKTANVILNTAFGKDTIAVDTHVFRVSNRTGLAVGDNVRSVEENLQKMVPSKFKKNAHHWLILHGRYVCTARRPHCDKCPVYEYCAYPNKDCSS